MEIFSIFVVVIFIAIVVRLAAGSMDGERIEQYIRETGGELIDKRWDPFGPGWVTEQKARIYQIVYKDRAGNTHRAHVKTSMLNGVYLANDHIIKEAPALTIEEEKASLKQRLAELEQE